MNARRVAQVAQVATYLALALAGASVGVWTAFLVPLRLPGGIEGLSDVLAFVTPIALGYLAVYGTGKAIAATVPGLSMLVVILVAVGSGPGGDLVVPGGLASDPGIGTVGTLLLFAAIGGTAVAVALASRRVRADSLRSGGTAAPSP